MRNPFRSVAPVVEVKAAAGVSTTTAQGFVQFSQSAAVNYAMSVPTISRARDLLASVVGAATIEQYAQQLDPVTGETSHVDLAPTGWMDRPDPAVTRNFLLANTFGDLFMFGRAFWLITSRYANGYPASFTWLPAADIQTADQQPPQWFGPSPQVTFGGQQIPSGDLVQFLSPITGLIYTAPRAIRTAYRLDAAAERFDAKALTNTYQMIKVVRMVGAKWGFSLLEDAPGEFNKLDEGLYKLVKHVFKLRRANPENQQDASKMYETMVNKATYRKFLTRRKGEVSWNIEAVKKPQNPKTP